MYALTMIPNPQYDYDYGPSGPLAALQTHSESPQYSYQIAPPIGWVPLVLALHEDLVAILPDYTIAQVKEKFAGLRFYIGSYGVDRDDPRIALAQDLIADAESASQTACQICGAPSVLRVGAAYYATLCEDHVGIKRGT